MSYSAVDGEFNVNESTMYTLNKVFLNRVIHPRLCIGQLMKMPGQEA